METEPRVGRMNTQLVESIVQVIHTLSPEEQALVRQKLSTVSPSALNIVPSSLAQRRAFLQKSPTERSQILAQQADTLLDHYQQLE
jgi:hypothetical protein